jgi:C_GCAxxG_C_C family probable redox protein
MSKKEAAIEMFNNNSACSQAVLTVFAEELGMDRALAHKLSTGFGAGIGRRQKICGAFSGGAMVLGLRYGNINGSESDKKDKTVEEVQKFLHHMEFRTGSLDCQRLLNLDLNTEEGQMEFSENNLKERVCAECIREAIEYLENNIKS